MVCCMVQLHQEGGGRRTEDAGSDKDEAGDTEGEDEDPELTVLNQSGVEDSLSIPEQDIRPKLILNIMSGSNDEKSVVMRQEEVEEQDQFFDTPPGSAPVILRHPRVPPLHGRYFRLFNMIIF